MLIFTLILNTVCYFKELCSSCAAVKGSPIALLQNIFPFGILTLMLKQFCKSDQHLVEKYNLKLETGTHPDKLFYVENRSI